MNNGQPEQPRRFLARVALVLTAASMVAMPTHFVPLTDLVAELNNGVEVVVLYFALRSMRRP